MKPKTTLAAPKTASRKSARSAKPPLSTANFEAPITVTFAGPTAAVVRFVSYLDDCSPEETAVRVIKGYAASELPSGFGMSDDDVAKMLGAAE
jgi:hypothetical protein